MFRGFWGLGVSGFRGLGLRVLGGLGFWAPGKRAACGKLAKLDVSECRKDRMQVLQGPCSFLRHRLYSSSDLQTKTKLQELKRLNVGHGAHPKTLKP